MRRVFCLLFLLLWLMLPAFAQAQPTLFVASDLHFISPALTDHGEYFTRLIESGDGKLVHYCNELTDAFVSEVIKAQPDCLILSGDLTFNGAKKSHEDLAAKLRRIDESGVPVLVMPGNHDLYATAAASFSGNEYTLTDGVTAEEFAALYHDLGFDEALFRDPYSLSYIAEPIPGVRILMLDTNTRSAKGTVTQSTLFWLEDMLKKAHNDGAKVIAVTHQNLYAHSSLFQKGYVLSNADALSRMYETYDVCINLSGHMHIQHTVCPEGKLPEIASSSLSVSPCQYGVISLHEGSAQYRAQAVDVAAWARENGKDDQNLLDFAQYAADFFTATSLSQSDPKHFDDPNARAKAMWLTNLNAAYFSGRMDTIDAGSEHAAHYLSGDSFMSMYVASMLKKPLRDHTQLTFPF